MKQERRKDTQSLVIVQEVLPEGSIELWAPELRSELQAYPVSTDVGQRLLFENDLYRFWSISLNPGERLPFHRHTRDYTWTCVQPGVALTRYGTGDVYRVEYQRGDLDFYNHQSKGDFVHDLENIGETRLEFVTTEFVAQRVGGGKA